MKNTFRIIPLLLCLLTVGTADEIMAQTGAADFEKAFVSLVKEARA